MASPACTCNSLAAWASHAYMSSRRSFGGQKMAGKLPQYMVNSCPAHHGNHHAYSQDVCTANCPGCHISKAQSLRWPPVLCAAMALCCVSSFHQPCGLSQVALLQLAELSNEKKKLHHEKIDLENQLEAEAEYIVNKLQKRVCLWCKLCWPL